MNGIRVVSQQRTVLGEGPVWNAAESRLYWVDCLGSAIHALTPSTGATESWMLPEYPGCYAFAPRGDLVMAFRRRIARVALTAGSATVKTIESRSIDFETERCNDGAVDALGRFWFGTMDRRLTQPVGGLYRLDLDHTITRAAGDITLSNGIAWSLDNTVLYHCESVPGRVYAYDFDLERGAVSNRRIFADMSNGEGRPDGCAVDNEGGLWVVAVGAGQLIRFTPDGRCERRLDLPVTRPTALAFGGPGMKTIYVTSMTHDLSEERLNAEPEAGHLLAFESEFAGTARPILARPV